MKYIVLLVLLITLSTCISKKSGHKLRKFHARHHMKIRHTHRTGVVTTTSSSSSSSSSSSVSNAPPGRYPDTEDDDLANPKLDTWIAPFTWKESLIEPKLPAELCKKPAGGDGGNDALSGPVYKHLELRKIRVSDGAAAYYFD